MIGFTRGNKALPKEYVIELKGVSKMRREQSLQKGNRKPVAPKETASPAVPAEVYDYSHDPVCRLCEKPYAGHPQCQCCNIYCGPNHFQEKAIPYRGKKLCDLCIKAWRRLDEKVGEKVPWLVFKNKADFYSTNDRPVKAWPVAEIDRR